MRARYLAKDLNYISFGLRGVGISVKVKIVCTFAPILVRRQTRSVKE